MKHYKVQFHNGNEWGDANIPFRHDVVRVSRFTVHVPVTFRTLREASAVRESYAQAYGDAHYKFRVIELLTVEGQEVSP